MANRNFASGGKIYSNLVMPVMLNCKIVIGATGAVSSITTNSLVSSVTRVSTGVYQINLANNYNAMIIALGSAISPSSGLSGILAVETANSPQTAIQNLATPTVTIKTLGTSGAVADPASGSTICVMIMADNSSVKA